MNGRTKMIVNKQKDIVLKNMRGAIVSFDNDYCNFHKEKAIKAWNRRAENV